MKIGVIYFSTNLFSFYLNFQTVILLSLPPKQRSYISLEYATQLTGFLCNFINLSIYGFYLSTPE